MGVFVGVSVRVKVQVFPGNPQGVSVLVGVSVSQVPVGGLAAVVRRGEEGQCDVGEALRFEVRADQVEHLGRTLVGDEPEVHPGARVCRQDGLDPGAAVAGVDAADVAGRRERQPLTQRLPGQTVDELLDPEELTELILDTRALLGDGFSRAPILSTRARRTE